MSGLQVPADPQTAAISAFWGWWRSGGAHELTVAIQGGGYGDLTETMTTLVQAIAPELQWELGKGTDSSHYLCVSAAGLAENRPATERWLRAAPAADGTWEFRAARQPALNWANSRLDLGGATVTPADAQVSLTVHQDSLRVDVTLYHPGFVGMGDQGRQQLTFLILDWVLGEDEVTRWLGAINHIDTRPADAVPVSALPAAIQSLAATVTPDRWVMLQGATGTGAPLLAMVRRPLRWIDHPAMDLHHTVVLPFADRRSDGLPSPEALDELTRLETDLLDRLEPQVLLLAHETSEGHRSLHVYSDSADQNVTGRIATWVAGTPRASVTSRMDPSWLDLAAFG